MSFENIKTHIETNYNVINFNKGHTKPYGCHANQYKNPFWEVEINGLNYILMYCEQNTVCKLCIESYNKILDYETIHNCKITWFKSKNGYIVGNNKLFIHQVITGCYGNGKGTKNISVDHIDRDPLNNTFENLRVATREEQEQNSKGIMNGTKRARKTSAIELPEGITQEMMPKYVYYSKEYRNPEKTRVREFFRVEKHPNLDKKCWSTSKASNVSIHDKLKEAINKIKELDVM